MNRHSDTVTLLWPADSRPAVVNDKFERLEAGEIRAEYTMYELALAMACMGKLEEATAALVRFDGIIR